MLENPADHYVDSPPEVEIAFDMVRRSLPIAPVFIIVSGLIWGLGGALSSAYGLGLVLINFVLAAGMLAFAARVSPVALMAASLGGFFIRMGLIAGAVFLVQGSSWVAMFPLLFTILVTHLGLLLWETRYVSATMAYPGLKPNRKGS
jgi:hypothetical protein